MHPEPNHIRAEREAREYAREQANRWSDLLNRIREQEDNTRPGPYQNLLREILGFHGIETKAEQAAQELDELLAAAHEDAIGLLAHLQELQSVTGFPERLAVNGIEMSAREVEQVIRQLRGQ